MRPRRTEPAFDLSPYRAPDAFGPAWGPWLAHAWHFIASHVRPGEIIRLCDATSDYLYSRHTPIRPAYRPGSRALLELQVSEALAPQSPKDLTPVEKALRLAGWTYWEVFRRGDALRRGRWTPLLIEGGTEEEVMAFDGRTGSFECSRVLASLLQAAGVPARLVFLFGRKEYEARAGVEAFLDGRWAFLDVKANAHYVGRDGRLAGLWQAATDPWCLRRGARGAVNPAVRVADRSAYALLAVANYPVKDESPWKPCPWARIGSQTPRVPDLPDEDWGLRARRRKTPRGKVARALKDLEPYRGWRRCPPYLRDWTRHCANEPPMSSQVHLCAETAPFLYSRFTPTVVKYRKGSRPALEALIQKVILRDGPRPASDQDMLFRVWDWVWRGVHRRLNQVVWSVHHRKFAYLGTAEDIAAFRCRADCYCSSRLSASLLQVAGIPARLVYMFAPDKGGGIHTMHTGAEAFIKGAWRFFDPLCHDYAVRPDGEMASFWEIATDRYCQTVGMRADPAQPDKVITDPRVFDDIYIHNYPIEETTAHYRRSGGSYGFDDDPAGARRVARFGL